MKLVLNKDILLEKLIIANNFVSQKISSSNILQGVCFVGEKNKINLFSTNLNQFYKTSIKTQTENFTFVLSPKELIEFLSLLKPGNIQMEIEEKKVLVKQEKTVGSFPLLEFSDYPQIIKQPKEKQKIKFSQLFNSLDLLLFSVSRDDFRPVLTGCYFVSKEDELVLVTTDGFRLSLLKTENIINWPTMIVPADFLLTLRRIIKTEDLLISYIEDEKMIFVQSDDDLFYSRTIEGDFPPYEKVIPTTKETEVVVDKEEFLRAIKIVSIFFRNQTNVIILEVKKDRLILRPKTDVSDNNTEVDAKTQGLEMSVAFNYKFLLDFLRHVPSSEKEIVISLVRTDAPVVFSLPNLSSYLHIIMPVRVQE